MTGLGFRAATSGSHTVITAIAAAVVLAAAAASAADVAAEVCACNCYGSFMCCKQMVAFVFAMHDGFGIPCSYVWLSRSYNRNCSRNSVSRSCSIRSRRGCQSVYVKLLW